jgi:hypothetical protein
MTDEKLVQKLLKEASDEYLKTKIKIPTEERPYQSYVVKNKVPNIQMVDYFVPNEKEAEIYRVFEADMRLGEQNSNRIYDVLSHRTPKQAQELYWRMFLSLLYWSEKDISDKRLTQLRKIAARKAYIYIAHSVNKILYGTPKVQNKKVKDITTLNYALHNANESVIKKAAYEEAIRGLVTSECYTPTAWIRKGYDYQYINDGEKKILDWKNSGHTHDVIDAREMFISNPYEPDVQKQSFIVRKRYINYSDAENIYGDNKNFKHVKKGYKQTYTFNNNTLSIEIDKDENSSVYIVEETTIWYRFKNRRYVFINGVIVSDVDGKMERADMLYPFEVKRYKKIPGQFYGVCVIQEFEQEETQASQLMTKVTEMVDWAMRPPMLIVGKQAIDTKFLKKGSYVQSTDVNTRIDPVRMGGDLNSAFSLLAKVEQMGQEEISDQQAGLPTGSGITATESKNRQNNLNVMSNTWFNSMKMFTKGYTLLITGDILEHDMSLKVDEETQQIISQDIVNPDVIADGEFKDVVVRPFPPSEKISLKKSREKLKEAGKFEFQDEIEYFVSIAEEEASDEKKKEIILFDSTEISTMMINVEVDIDQLNSLDKVSQRAEFNEMLTVLGPLGTVDPQKITQHVLEDYLGPKAKEFMQAPQEFAPGAVGSDSISNRLRNQQLTL